MKGVAKWVLVVGIVLALLVVARDPGFWKRYFLTVAGSSGPGFSLYEPRERVAGANEPPPPRVAPELESLDRKALETAADYAGARDSTALIVMRHEHIVFEKYWHGTSFETVEDGQSFARIVAALAAGAALSRRQIHWPDEPIGAFIPEWRNDPRGAITVTQLLKMSSGLRPPPPSLSPWGAGVRAALGSDVIAADLAEPLEGKPGAVWAEQSADPQLLALVIERATGLRYAEFVSQALWRRIGASDAWLWLDRPGGHGHADCCMLAHQGDWIRVAGLLIRDGNYRGDEVMRPGWIAHLLVPAKGNVSYGSYVRLGSSRTAGTEPYATNDLFLVEGSGGNRLWLVPSLQLAILRMGRLPPRAADWDDATIPNLIIHGARDYQPLQPTDLSKIVPGH
ncbi:MAG TPA: serine hydrolase [Steroidobacteraceae bacterium]|nr:serine hydrolase [Steroidobacteraceae bacterium]